MAQGEDSARQDERAEPISFVGALRDLGFISWLFAFFVGTPSVLTLIQTVADGVTLSAGLQWLIDGYNQILSVIAIIVDPLASAVATLAADLFDMELELFDHWQPLFVLAAIFVSANARTLWGDGMRAAAILFVIFAGVAVLVASVAAGLAPPSASWLVQGATAAQFVILTFFGFVIAYSIAALFFGFSQPYRKPLLDYARRGLLMGAAAFAIAAGLSFLPATAERAGLITIFGGLFVYGLYWLGYGVTQRNRPEIRFGLRVIGGFLFAAVALGADHLLQNLT